MTANGHTVSLEDAGMSQMHNPTNTLKTIEVYTLNRQT